ncbi:hypothetical protein GE09DRAFT_1236001 [Coniochaeta sp. 2T2.1]|nr:hypothetical protein GE09DRAFT_1236001 [Coniochaeta sp. 2T2.1]
MTSPVASSSGRETASTGDTGLPHITNQLETLVQRQKMLIKNLEANLRDQNARIKQLLGSISHLSLTTNRQTTMVADLQAKLMKRNGTRHRMQSPPRREVLPKPRIFADWDHYLAWKMYMRHKIEFDGEVLGILQPVLGADEEPTLAYEEQCFFYIYAHLSDRIQDEIARRGDIREIAQGTQGWNDVCLTDDRIFDELEAILQSEKGLRGARKMENGGHGHQVAQTGEAMEVEDEGTYCEEDIASEEETTEH